MKASDIPDRFPIPFADDAGGSYIRPIPEDSQIGIQDGAASLTDGFPPLNFVPVIGGGKPPFGQDFNGILNQITLWSRWQGAGATVGWDSAFSTSVSGYPAGAIVAAASGVGDFWLCTIDDNTSDPDSAGAGWSPFTLGVTPSSVPVGTIIMFSASAPPTGYLECNGANISKTTYADLFAVIGNTYAAGSTTFGIPDGRGYFFRGWDHGAGIDPSRGFPTAQSDAFESHTHTFTLKSSDASAAFAADGSGTTSGNGTTNATGDTETRPVNITMLPCIKY